MFIKRRKKYVIKMHNNLKLKTAWFVSGVKFLFLRITLGFLLTGFLFVGCNFAEQSAAVGSKSASVQDSGIDKVCDLIYEGKFVLRAS